MPQKTNKTNHYEELKQFKLKKGHCEVPQKNNKTISLLLRPNIEFICPVRLEYIRTA